MSERLPFDHDPQRDVRSMREVLIAHLDGELVPIRPGCASREHRAFLNLIDRKMLEAVPKETPRHSVITDKGREELAGLLADYAETLLKVALANDEARYDRSLCWRPEPVRPKQLAAGMPR
jgi:hypothetical protein